MLLITLFIIKLLARINTYKYCSNTIYFTGNTVEVYTVYAIIDLYMFN